MRIIECVPNFSVARNKPVVKTIVDEVKSQKGVKLLNSHVDPDHGRLVLTYIGEPEAVGEAAFALAATAVELIDVHKHEGVHPWFGAIDVIPFIPLKARMSDCIKISHEVGKEIAEKLKVPVYLYGEAATRPERRDLSEVRKGGYEALLQRINLPEWKPDYGEPKEHPTAGAVAIGARDTLIAFNVNLNSDRLEIARAIAGKIREKDGGLPGIKALGVPLESRGIVQVTTNITDFRKTSLKQVFEAIKNEAEKYRTPVLESEIVGLIPKEATFPEMKDYLQLPSFDDSKILETHLAVL